AGPEVFLPFYEKVSRFLQAQTLLFNEYHLKDSNYHIQGLFPSDESDIGSYSDYFKAGTEIYNKNRSLMSSSHAIIANMTRHGGSSMDVGTAYEIGEMVQAQKTVVGYYDEKIYHSHYSEEVVRRDFTPSSEDASYNQEDLILEPLEIPDNLMVFMATLSPQEEIKIPSSSWEALFVLKAKLDTKEEP
ncbi:MAG: nucleoside 2-deoxyribosyltransferase, partial [Oligoflexia bacterium]|nr:nucleoside 2-deoxyribosyltransferase [Oligoflexia bacterium]